MGGVLAAEKSEDSESSLSSVSSIPTSKAKKPLVNGLPMKSKDIPKTAQNVKRESTQKKETTKPVKTSPKKKEPVVSTDSEDAMDAVKKKKPAKNTKKKKSYTEESEAEDSEYDDIKQLKTTYCFDSCFKEESNEMIGCDFCEMWYHPDCLGLSEEQAESLTENDSWMCPEC